MSLEIKEQSCPICKAYLFEDDEVAVCPTCGAPHHRECFVSLGHCGLEEFHGTDKQYDKAKKQNEAPKQEQKQEQEEKKELCPSCKKEVLNGSTFCNHCGAPLNQNNPYVIRIDYLGGVKPETDLGNGHKANDVKDFVAVSTNRIIPMFKRFKKGAKVAFSFWHLLFPAASFAMRKMYSFACLSGALEVAATLLMLPLNIVMGGIMQEHDVKNYYELAQYMVANMDKALMSNFILATVGIVVQLFNRIMSALFANRLYYGYVLKAMSEIKKNAEDEEEKILLYHKRGGVNIFAFVLFYMAVAWLPTIIYSFI
ncbi:MAG: zinc-ribbon domain-containing protein [Clostridia bacterium]|nr:zinc-ribbon domain-containing protein [Clostridia bacterium]